MHVIPRLLAGLVVCLASTLATGPSRAEFRGAEHLAGWWLSVDEVAFPPLWGAGITLPMEELLIIDGEGRFQSRMMMFRTPEASQCRDITRCSDAPMLATGRVAVSGGTLSFSQVTSTGLTADGAETDADIRARILPALARWQVDGEAGPGAGILRLKAAANAPTRIFVKVEPDTLRRLRAGFVAQNVSASRYWRCYLGRVAGDPARAGRLEPDPSVRAYLAAASLAQAIESLRAQPAGGGSGESRQAALVRPPEHLMAETFAALPAPSTAVERRRLDILMVILEQVRQGQTWEQAMDRVRRVARPADMDVPLGGEERRGWQEVGQNAQLFERLFCHARE